MAKKHARSAGSRKPRQRGSARNPGMGLRLYVAGQTPKSVAAMENLQRICREHLDNKCTIEVIDLLENPQLARGDQIVAIPTVVKKVPQPLRKLIGDLSNSERVLVGLDIRKFNKS